MAVRLIYYFISYFAAAFVLALAITPLIRPLAFKVGAVDRGEGRRAHKGVIPRLGGVAIFLAFTIPFGFYLTRGEWDLFHKDMAGILIGATIVFLAGINDDIKGGKIRYKLMMEILAAMIVYAWGIRITVISNPFGGLMDLGLLDLPVTVLWIIVITNAINLIDGLDGLAAGTVILISATLFSLSADVRLQVVFVIFAGSLFGFLRYNFPPASIFMGDAGSLFLGFFLGATSIISFHKATAIVAMMVPIIAFGFPLMDMFYAVLRRYYRGIPLGEADKEHIHHKLLEKGLSKKKVLLVLYSLNVVIMLGVLLVIQRQMEVNFFGLLFMVVLAVLGMRTLGYIELLPFMREMIRGFVIGRKRKFFNYVIDRFRRDAGKSRSADDFRDSLTAIMKEYNFSRAEIHLAVPGMENPFYIFTNIHKKGNPIKLSFPLVREQNEVLGYIEIRKQIDDEYFLCTAEMVRALSEEVSRFVTKYLSNQ